MSNFYNMYPAVKITHRPTFKCPCPNTLNMNDLQCKQNLCNGTEKDGNHFSGNTNNPGFAVTNTFLMSTAIRTSRFRTGSTVTRFANSKVAPTIAKCSIGGAAPVLNAFGRWEGAPGGSGSPPTNRF